MRIRRMLRLRPARLKKAAEKRTTRRRKRT
jgi:hypothetical protein